MGIGSSTLQLRNPARFSISNLSITNAPSDGDCVATTAALNIRYSDETAEFTNNLGKPTEFVVDPDHNDFLLKIPYSDVIQFKFRLRIVPPVDSVTFISASSTKQLETFLSTELFHNPNIQNEDNVALLGDIKVTAEGGPGPRNVDFTWTWKADPRSIHGTCGRKALCFAEYDKRDHKLSTLAAFSIWIENPSTLDPPSPVNAISPSSNINNSSLANAPFPTNSHEHTLSPSTLPVNIEKKSSDVNYQLPSTLTTTATTTNNLTSVSRHPSTVSSSVGSNFSTVSPLDTNRIAAESFALSPSETIQNSIDLATLPEIPIGPPATHVITGESITRVLERERKVSSVPRPADPGSGSDQGMLEDGPLFRATVSSMEKKNSNLKVLIKKILKRSLLLFERQEALISAMRMFDDSLKDASDNEISGLQPLTQNYFNKSAPYSGLQDFLVINLTLLKTHVIEPLRRLYEQDIKTAELRKREFDDESQQYYSWLSRYLAMKQEAKGKKKSDSDSKYLDKRKAFELSRFDYYTFLSDLHGGRKQLDVIYHLGLYAESEVSNLFAASDNFKQKIKPDLDLVISEIREAHKDWSRYRTERELQRRNLEQPIRKTVAAQSSNTPQPINTLAARNFSHEELSSEDDDELLLVTPTISKLAPSSSIATVTGVPRLPKLDDDSNNSFNNSELSDFGKLTIDTSSRDLQNGSFATPTTANNSLANTSQDYTPTEPIKYDSHRKEGLLWSMSRTGDPLANLNKAGWHKYWIVLAGGKLSEYTNWKQNLDLHNEPVNLKTACVREARSSDRRFCFEVVTPQFKRIYQATSDEDMRSWIRSIQNGINTSLHRDSISGLSADDKPSGTSAPTGITGSKADQNRSGLHRALNSGVASSSDSNDILKAIHHSPSNRQCADCGSTERVEWVSINLLVVLCIDCSGVHRSLGSHISKIRSLTLDTVSFTPELVSLLKNVCNAQLNSVWEEELKQEKPYPLPNRLSFITEKYVEKKYIRPLERPNAELRRAVAEQDLIQILRALASRANPNATVTETTNNSPTEESISGKEIDKGTSLLLYAFKCAPKDSTIFPVVELLMLNGAQNPTETLPIPELSEAANKYLERRQSQLSRKLTVNTGTTTNNSASPVSSSLLSPDKRAGNMGAKLQKRLSTGFANR